MTAGWNWSADDVRRVGYRAVDFIADYLSDLPHRPVFQPYPGERANALAAEPVPVIAAIGHLERAVLGADWTEGIVHRYGAFY